MSAQEPCWSIADNAESARVPSAGLNSRQQLTSHDRKIVLPTPALGNDTVFQAAFRSDDYTSPPR